MKMNWKNHVKIIGYVAVIMLLLFSSLPLSGVFAEPNQSEDIKDEVEGQITEQSTQDISEQEPEQTQVETQETIISDEIRIEASTEEWQESILTEDAIKENTTEEEVFTEEYLGETNEDLGTVTDSIDKNVIELQGSMEKEGHFSYREDYGRNVILSLWADGFDEEQDEDICYTISSSNEAVFKPKTEQEIYYLTDGAVLFEIMGVGQAELTIQPMEQDFYSVEKLTFPIVVENSAIRDEDYMITYIETDGTETQFLGDFTKWQDFLEAKRNWVNGSVRIELSEAGAQYYAGLGYLESQEEKQLVLSDETPFYQYDFWCSNLQNNVTTKEKENGICSFVMGIDKTAPHNTEISYNQNAYVLTSTETTKYYGETLVITGAFQDTLSGVESIEYTTQAALGEEAEWKAIQNITEEDVNTSFELVLEQGYFEGIAIRATDMTGNRSEPVEIRNEKGEYLTFVVDKMSPLLTVLSKTADEKVYHGEWTNQPVTISVQEATEYKSLSGIQTIQYQYVSIGGEYEPDKWEELPEDGLLKIGHDEEEKTNQNGIYYFRAISNTGMITEIEAQKQNAIRIRMQQTMPEKEGIVETAPKREEEQIWYNRESGVPQIAFVYPKYDDGVIDREYDAPITIHTKLSDEKEGTSIHQTATIGIPDDRTYQKLCAGEESKVPSDDLKAMDIDFSHDAQTGYAADGIYELEYWISDAAGNESEHDVYTYYIDTHEPEKLEILVNGTPMETDSSQTIIFDRFYQEAVSGSASADFGISGKGIIKLMLAESIGDWEENRNWMQGESFLLEPCTSGCIYMVAEDVAGNQATLRTSGIVVDNQAPKGANGGSFLSITTKANDNRFYNKDIAFTVMANDLPQNKGFSGLESVSLIMGTEGKDNEQRKELFDKNELTATQSYTTAGLMDASVFEGNDTYVEIIARDRCGNTATSREEVKIDITPPKVEISFDRNEAQNGCFYKTARTATIHVQELNFDKQGVELNITRDTQPYTILLSDWQTDGIEHWATVTFLEDGDYTMEVSCTDLADNTSEAVCAEPFTLDLTSPVMEITYDNNTASNDIYFQTKRTAYLTVQEHNFREADFRITAEQEVPMSGWSHEGDKHVLQLYFTEDNHYRFSCDYTDLAGNAAESLVEQEFYIDSVAPQIVISGVEDGSANAGEITPVITVYDTNHNRDDVDITVTTGIGELVPLTIQIQEKEQGCSYILTDMSEKEDDIFSLQVTAYDMAHNKSEMVYRFSLNRHGSTYDLTQISPIIERVYNRSDQITDISILEMNVDEIESYSIYLTRNGKMLSCKEIQQKPQVDLKEDEIYYSVETTGNEKSGYCNRYIFYQENFAKEGSYRITCYSKDRAGNEMNNTLKEKKAEVSFVIDNTPPKVVINGVEAGGVYNKEFQIVHLMVQDNFKLEEAKFQLVNQAGKELQSWDYMELAREAGDMVSITIPSLEEKQSLRYFISDAAGNEIVLLPDSEEAPTGFLITTNKWLQFISSPGKIAVVACALISFLGIWAGLYHKIRQKTK